MSISWLLANWFKDCSRRIAKSVLPSAHRRPARSPQTATRGRVLPVLKGLPRRCARNARTFRSRPARVQDEKLPSHESIFERYNIKETSDAKAALLKVRQYSSGKVAAIK